MSRSLTTGQVRRLAEIRIDMAYHQGALDELVAQAGDVVGIEPGARERFDDELLYAGLTWDAADAARWADDSEAHIL